MSKLLERCKNLRADLLNAENGGYKNSFPIQLDREIGGVKDTINTAIREIEDLDIKSGIDLLEDASWTLEEIYIDEAKFEDKFLVEIKEFLADVEKALKNAEAFEGMVETFQNTLTGKR